MNRWVIFEGESGGFAFEPPMPQDAIRRVAAGLLQSLQGVDPAAHAALIRAAAADAGLRCLTADQSHALDAYRRAVAADPMDTCDARDELLLVLMDEHPSEEGEADGR